MALNNPLANALSTIMNAERVSKAQCVLYPVNTVIKKTLDIMNEQGYIGTYTEVKDSKGNVLKVNLLGYINKCNVITPHFAVKKDQYEKYEKRYLPSKDFGFIVVSTPQGIMTHEDAKKKSIGGKLLAYCY